MSLGTKLGLAFRRRQICQLAYRLCWCPQIFHRSGPSRVAQHMSRVVQSAGTKPFEAGSIGKGLMDTLDTHVRPCHTEWNRPILIISRYADAFLRDWINCDLNNIIYRKNWLASEASQKLECMWVSKKDKDFDLCHSISLPNHPSMSHPKAIWDSLPWWQLAGHLAFGHVPSLDISVFQLPGIKHHQTKVSFADASQSPSAL